MGKENADAPPVGAATHKLVSPGDEWGASGAGRERTASEGKGAGAPFLV